MFLRQLREKTSLDCANPYDTPHTKSKNVQVRLIHQKLLAECLKYLQQPKITASTNLCMQCRTRLTREAKVAAARQITGSHEEALNPMSQEDSPNTPDVSHREVVLPTTEDTVNPTPVLSQDQQTAGTSKTSRGVKGILGLPFLFPVIPKQPIRSPTKSSTTIASLQSYQESETSSIFSGGAFVDVNRIITPLGISPAKPSDLSKPGVMKSKLHRSVQVLEETLSKAADVTMNIVCEDCADLLINMKQRYPELISKNHKYMMLTCAPKSLSCNALRQKTGCSWYEAKKAQELRFEKGVLQYPEWKSPGHELDERTVNLVTEFYLSTDNAKISADAKDAVRLYSKQVRRCFIVGVKIC
ncbi:unnamed protein product [Allacma fusca]|uniref:Uncharacterized protein n=1 Tax=Allacma fusca TaxID=39272 RepID=A0A8J2NN89_9HEXA|nr:unnamed protein product [Allacma fusca]